MSKLKKIVVDDGSIASKLLQHEYKDAQVQKVNGTNIIEWFTKFDPKRDNDRIYLPFSADSLVENNEQRRNEVNKVKALGFSNLVVLPYEGDSEQTIKERAVKAKVADREILKGESKEPDTERHKLSYPEYNGVVKEDERKPYKSVRTENRKVSDL